MIKGDPNEEIQFLGAVLIVSLVLGAIGFATLDMSNTGYASEVLTKMYAPTEKLPGFCVKQGDDSIYVQNTVQYRDFNGNTNSVSDFCRGFDTRVLAEYGCKGDNLVSTDIHCQNGCLNGACTH